MRFLPSLSQDQLTELAKLTGGAATLVVVALFISGASSFLKLGTGLAAAVVCNAGTCEQQTTGGYTLTLDVGSATVDSGEPATINWDVRDGSDNPPPSLSFDFSSFGNGTTPNQSLDTIASPAGSTYTNFPRADLISFVISGTTYVSVLRNNAWDLYKWIPASNCLGNTSCDSAIRSTSMSTPYSQAFFTQGGTPYIAVGDSTTIRIYKWMSGSSCFGSGSVCWSTFQTISVGGQSLDYFTLTIGTTGDYLVVGTRSNDVRVYKWQSSGSGCPSGGGFGNGSSCNSTGYKTINTLGANIPYAVKAFTQGSDTFLGVGLQTGSTDELRIFKWLELAPSGQPCFGRNSSTACNTPYAPNPLISIGGIPQTESDITSIVAVPGSNKLFAGAQSSSGIKRFNSAFGTFYREATFGDTNVRIRTVTDGYDTYLLSGSYNSSSNSPKVYKWMVGNDCFGDGNSCDVPYVTFSLPSGTPGSQPSYAMTAFVVNNTWYLANIYGNSQITIYKATPPPPCFGGTNEECGNHIKDNSGSPALGQTINHTFDWEPFKIGSNWYVARAAQSGYWYDRVNELPEYVDSSQHSAVYKWHPAEEAFGHKTGTVTNTTCYDGTSSCIDYKGPFNNTRMNGTVYQDIFSHTAYDWMAFTMGGGTYLMLSSDPAAGSGTVGSQLYKWGSQASKGTAGGLRGEYFNNEYFYGSSISRTEGPIDFDYGSGKPSGVDVDSVITSTNNFSIRWTGTIVAPVAGTYTFTLDADDGARLWLDDILVLDKWNNNGSNSYTVNNVQANQNISVRIEYHEETGNARARLYWAYPGQTTQIIPASSLYPNQVATEGCLGNGKASGTTCGSPFQTMAVSATDSTFFTTGTGSYLLMAGSTGRLYKWESSLNSGAGCFSGNGTNCDTFASTLQSINASNPWALATTTVGSDLYVAMGLAGTSNGVRIYKWRTSGTSCLATGSFGNASNCDTSTAYQTLAPGTVKELQFFVPAGDSTVHLAIASENDNKVYIYKWQSSGTGCPSGGTGGFGDGTTCGTALQSNISFTTDPHTFKVFTIAGITYLTAKKSDDNETARIMRWQGSCFGDGTTCGNSYSTVTLGSATEDTNAFLFFTPDNTNYYFAFGGEGSNPYLDTGNRLDSAYLYKWLDPASLSLTAQSACSVTWVGLTSGDSGSLGSANSAGPIVTEPLTEDTRFTLSCDGLVGSAVKTVTVNEPVTSFPQPPVSIQAGTAADAALVEGASPTDTASFTVSYTGTASTSDIIVSYTVSGTAAADTDYTALSGTVTIPANETSATITVSSPSSMNDTIHEGDETVVVTLNDSGGASEGNYDLGTPTNASVTITDTETDTTLPSNGGNAFTVCTGTASASCTLGVTPASVRRGSTVTVTWYVTGLITGSDVSHPGNTCTVSASPNLAGFPKTSSAGETEWVNTGNTVKPTILQRTTFTFSCSAPNGTTKTTPVSKTINILPGFQEI